MATTARTSVLESNLTSAKPDRAANRRSMRSARPSIEPATKFRIRQWAAAIEKARDSKAISLGCDRYLKRIKGQCSVAHGGYADVRDKVMGDWLRRSRRTVIRYRAEAIKAKLLEDTDTHGKDHQPCMVRPILPDGPVFAGKSVTLSPPEMSHRPTEYLPTEQSLSEPADLQPERKEVAFKKEVEVCTFREFWIATDMAGIDTIAEREWLKLKQTERAAISALVRAGPIRTGRGFVWQWLQGRRWEWLPKPMVGVKVHRDSPQGAAWQRHWRAIRKVEPFCGRDGCYAIPLPSEWPE